MKLDELHVADFSARAVCHRYTIAGSHRRVGAIAIQLAKSAGGQQHSRCAHMGRLAGVANQVNSCDTSVLDQ